MIYDIFIFISLPTYINIQSMEYHYNNSRLTFRMLY